MAIDRYDREVVSSFDVKRHLLAPLDDLHMQMFRKGAEKFTKENYTNDV